MKILEMIISRHGNGHTILDKSAFKLFDMAQKIKSAGAAIELKPIIKEIEKFEK